MQRRRRATGKKLKLQKVSFFFFFLFGVFFFSGPFLQLYLPPVAFSCVLFLEIVSDWGSKLEKQKKAIWNCKKSIKKLPSWIPMRRKINMKLIISKSESLFSFFVRVMYEAWGKFWGIAQVFVQLKEINCMIKQFLSKLLNKIEKKSLLKGRTIFI